MSLYAQYIAAREGFETVEGEFAFATYKIEGETVYLRDMFIAPEKRQKISAYKICDMVEALGKKAGCKKILTSVCPQDPNATQNMRVVLHHGFKLNSASPQLILFEKELSNG